VNPSDACKRRPNTGLGRSLVLGSALLLLAGCQLPRFIGPQIQDPPPGFRRESQADQNRKMFPSWERIHHDAWVYAAWGDVSTIHINGYTGTIMRADVQSALEDAMASDPDPVTFSGVQEMIIDGRPAWGWAERLHTNELGLVWIAYKVAIPYDTITYTVELFSGDPALKRAPDTLLAIAATFGIGQTTWNIPLIVGIIVVLVILIFTARKRNQQKQARLQSITLKKVEIKKEGEEGAEGEEAVAGEGEDDTPVPEAPNSGVPKAGAPPVFTPSKPTSAEPKPPAPGIPPEDGG
jgi:hypothetical protein